MGLLMIIAGAVVASILVATLRTSQTRSAQLLVHDLTLWPARDAPSGAHRSAAIHLAVAFVIAWIIALGLFALGDRWRTNAIAETALSWAGLACGFAGFASLWLAIRELARALRKPKREPPSGAA